jgi:hypothetical protein
VETCGKIPASYALFINTPSVLSFSYDNIRDFSRKALQILKESKLKIRSIATTIHGVGFGLDESECFLALLGGFFDAFQSNLYPENLEKISIVERDWKRVTRLGQVLTKNIGFFSETAQVVQENPMQYRLHLSSEQTRFAVKGSIPQTIENAGVKSTFKPYVFVAMPFSNDFRDTFDYAIYPSISDNGFLCERVDYSSFTGSIVEYVLKKIKGSSLVVAELSGANPNVYLELGYAWGLNIPTVLLVKDGENLKFDVQGQRVLMYGRIKDLEDKLRKELSNLKANDVLR